MTYHQFLKLDEVKKALKASFTDSVEPLIPDHVLDQSGLLDGPMFRRKFVEAAIVAEIDARKKHLENQKTMAELEEKMRPYRERDAKVKAVMPTVEKYVAGNLQERYQSIEIGAIRMLSESIVERFGDRITLDDSGQIVTGQPEPKTEGMSELDKILTRARITRLDSSLSVDEMFYHTLNDSGVAPLMK